jgi:WD40 repeat protein
MSTVHAPYPSKVLDLEGPSIVSVAPSGDYNEYLDFYNNAGEEVAHLHVHNPDFYYAKALKRIGSFESGYREVLIKDWRRAGEVNPKLANPSPIPPGTVNDVAWSPDGEYVAVGHVTAPYLTVYKRIGDTFVNIVVLSITPTSAVNAVAWSPDGRLLAIGTASTPYIQIYSKVAGQDQLNQLSLSAAMPSPPTGGQVMSLAFSPDARYLAVGSGGTPYLILYDRGPSPTSTVLSRVSDLTETQRPTATVRSVGWSPDMNYLFAGGITSPYFQWYKRSGSLLTKLPTPSRIVTHGTTNGAWSPTGKYLAIASSSSGALYIYKRVGDTLVAVDPGLTLSDSSWVESVAWSPDGRYLVAGSGNGSSTPLGLQLWKVIEEWDSFPYLNTAIGVQPVGNIYAVEFSPDGNYLIAGSNQSPRFAAYKSLKGPIAGAALRLDKDYPMPG